MMDALEKQAYVIKKQDKELRKYKREGIRPVTSELLTRTDEYIANTHA